jgi:CubicO group peptidase (beta-lactamase class C family)
MPASPLPRRTPESQGLASAAVLAWLDALADDHLELHSFMLLQNGAVPGNGAVVAEGWWAPYRPEQVHHLYSLSKSFTSAAIGLLVDEGQLSLNDRLVELFPEALPAEVSSHLADLRVQDLLTMRSGHAEDVTGALFAAPDADGMPWHGVRAVLAQPLAHPPGTHFVYNSAATFLLSAVVQRLSGQSLLDYLRPRLLEPLGITQAHWATTPQGVAYGGWGLQLTTEGVARFGQLLLQGGRWVEHQGGPGGRQLLPATWVQAATQAQVPATADPTELATSDWAQGYGFQFWRCRHGAYRADGAFGQFCVVMPQQGAVLAVTANAADMQRVLDHVWTHLLAGMGEGTLPDDPAAVAELRARCGGLSLAAPATDWDGTPHDETYFFETNPEGLSTARLETGPTACRLTLTVPQGEHAIDFGLGEWQEGSTRVWGETDITVTRASGKAGQLTLNVVLTQAGFGWVVTVDRPAGTLHLHPPPMVRPDGGMLLARRHLLRTGDGTRTPTS